MKRRPPQDMITTLYRVKAQIDDAAELLGWYLMAGNTMTQQELNQLTEARRQLMNVLVG